MYPNETSEEKVLLLIEIKKHPKKLTTIIKYVNCILQVKSAEKCNDFLHSLAAHFLFYLVI